MLICFSWKNQEWDGGQLIYYSCIEFQTIGIKQEMIIFFHFLFLLLGTVGFEFVSTYNHESCMLIIQHVKWLKQWNERCIQDLTTIELEIDGIWTKLVWCQNSKKLYRNAKFSCILNIFQLAGGTSKNSLIALIFGLQTCHMIDTNISCRPTPISKKFFFVYTDAPP